MRIEPKRIRRSRAKGWKMPENAVYVGRPTRWGNPFIVGKHGNAEYCNQLFAAICLNHLVVSADRKCLDAQIRFQKNLTKDLEELRGKDLACWCALDKPCHAEVLLKLANKR